jgi:hypothetical protein
MKIPRHPRCLTIAALVTAHVVAAPLRSEIIMVDETNATLAVSQIEIDGDTSENPDVVADRSVGQRLSFTETGTNDYGCCGGREGTYGLGNLNDGDIGVGVPSDGTYAIPTSGEGMVDITLDAGVAAVGGIAIYNGYGNRDDGTYSLRDGAGNLIASWTISATPGASNSGVDSFYLQFKAPVTTNRLVIDGQVGDCCGTASFREIQVFGPTTDTDNDGMPDAYEVANGLNPSVNDAAADLDGDGLTNLQDYQRGTAANRADTDEDGLGDLAETNTGTYASASDTGTHPLKADTDGDGLFDGAETRTGTFAGPTSTGSDPLVADSDADGFVDGVEVLAGFNPNQAASTPVDTSAIRTAIEFQFFPEPGVGYRIEGSADMQEWTVLETNIVGNGTRISRFYSTETQAARFFRAQRN